MDVKMKFTINIPEEISDMLGIDEDTLFVTSYEDGILSVEPILDEEEDEDEEYEEEEEESESENTEGVTSEGFKAFCEGKAEGYLAGFEEGYLKGYRDGSNKHPYNDHAELNMFVGRR